MKTMKYLRKVKAVWSTRTEPKRIRPETTRSICLVAAAVLLAPSYMTGQPTVGLPSAAVGRNLEAPVTVSLSSPAQDDGASITIRSSDPVRLLISSSPDQVGSDSLVLRVRQGSRRSPEIWLQALSDAGEVTYTAETPGFTAATGTVTLTPSAIVIMGPFKASTFTTTTGAAPAKITLVAARLDSSLNVVEEQTLAGGLLVQAAVTSSNKAVGIVSLQPAGIRGGASTDFATFQAAGEGETKLSLTVPAGFRTPVQFAVVTAVVRQPGLAVSDRMSIGQNLQTAGVLSLGEAAPAKGLTVTLVSGDPSRLLLSQSATEIGAGSIAIEIPPGGYMSQYYLQAIGNTGTVTYTASAPGFRTRTGTLALTPSGIILTPASQGPPDEAQVMRKEAPDGTHRFTESLSQRTPTMLVAWPAQLDPATLRAADITVQQLRAGLTLNVSLINNNPEVGSIASLVTIQGGSDHGVVDFTPVSPGSSEISVVTPANFTTPANSTVVVANVDK
jgi:hypothetical protein